MSVTDHSASTFPKLRSSWIIADGGWLEHSRTAIRVYICRSNLSDRAGLNKAIRRAKRFKTRTFLDCCYTWEGDRQTERDRDAERETDRQTEREGLLYDKTFPASTLSISLKPSIRSVHYPSDSNCLVNLVTLISLSALSVPRFSDSPRWRRSLTPRGLQSDYGVLKSPVVCPQSVTICDE